MGMLIDSFVGKLAYGSTTTMECELELFLGKFCR